MLTLPKRGVAARVAVVGAILLAVACSDPFSLEARLDNVGTRANLWALTGTPPNYPAAFDISLVSPVRADGNLAFDFATDLESNGSIRIIPQAMLGQSLLGARVVGLRRVSGTYEALLEAPADGYSADSVLVVKVGEPFVARVRSQACSFQLSQELFAKFVVDTVIASERRMSFRTVIDPNCGFRGLGEGRPRR
ncbi:MAG: hypothetical protein K2X99_06260 [Gemmatimonadaceae bacterium]|nr:hypothetical protein [Gemmatimonadaceae bacterium]